VSVTRFRPDRTTSLAPPPAVPPSARPAAGRRAAGRGEGGPVARGRGPGGGRAVGRRAAGRHGAGWLAALLPGSDAVAVSVAALATGAGLVRGASYGLAVLIAMAAGGLYRRRIGSRVSDQAGRLVVAAVLPALILLPSTPPGLLIQLAGCTAGLVIALRWTAQAGLRAARRRGLLARPALIVGGGQPGARIAVLLREHPELGLRPCGALDSPLAAGGQTAGGQAAGGQAAGGQAVLGTLAEAGPVIDRFGIRQVLICSPDAPAAELAPVVQACRDRGVPVSLQPQLPAFGLEIPRSGLDEIWAVPFVPLRPGPGGRPGAAAKRALDLALGSVFALAAAPVLAVLAVAVRAEYQLPPLFRQVRVVGCGRRATITKLRTLRPAGDPDTSWVVTEGQCTRLGRLLRGSHADELPQLASVLRGDMSLTGPRPERPHFARQLRRVPGYADRERVRGGLTGWAQVHGLTGDTSIEDRARFDNYYIEYWSAWLDLMVLARTLPAALRGALTTKGGSR
jgi:lipopolysaccharide/colanic/teichoic acid biosynthesis glycosyltransferase